MPLTHIVSGNYGYSITITVTEDRLVRDISHFTTRRFVFTSPSGERIMKEATLVTDGLDGRMRYIVEKGVIAEPGIWHLSVILGDGATHVESRKIPFPVSG